MDEFPACLEKNTDKIIAFNLQKMAIQQGKVATSKREVKNGINAK